MNYASFLKYKILWILETMQGHAWVISTKTPTAQRSQSIQVVNIIMHVFTCMHATNWSANSTDRIVSLCVHAVPFRVSCWWTHHACMCTTHATKSRFPQFRFWSDWTQSRWQHKLRWWSISSEFWSAVYSRYGQGCLYSCNCVVTMHLLSPTCCNAWTGAYMCKFGLTIGSWNKDRVSVFVMQ